MGREQEVSIKDLSLKLSAISLIADEAKRTKDRLRAELQAEMDAIGADRVKAELGDDVVAYVTTTKPKFKWEIVNDKKFLNWVKEQMPSEIVESVRESYVDWVFAHLKYEDDLVIAPNGEIVDWAAGTETEPYLTTRFQADGRDRLKDAMMQKTIDAIKMLELE